VTDPTTDAAARWLGPGVAGIGTASFLADVGHESPPPCCPTCSPSHLAPTSALGLIEGVSDELAGVARLAGGALAHDPHRRRVQAVDGYTHNRRPLQPAAPSWEAAHLAAHRLVATEQGRVLAWAALALVSRAEQAGIWTVQTGIFPRTRPASNCIRPAASP
jgi:hypothetical protein